MNQLSQASDNLQAILESAEERLRSSGNTAEYSDLVLDESRRALRVHGIIVWDAVSDGPPRLRATCGNLPAALQSPNSSLETALSRIRPGTVRTERDIRSALTTDSGNSAAAVSLLLSAADVAEDYRLIVGFYPPATETDESLVRDLTEILADLRRRSLMKELVSGSVVDQKINQLIALLHSDLDELRVVNTLASDSAELLNCRRIAVVRRSGSGWSLVAATAVSSPDPRSDASRQLCRVVEEARLAAAASQPVTEPNRIPQSVPQVGTSQLVRPLSRDGRWSEAEWAVVFEPASGRWTSAEQSRIARVCLSASMALANCSDHLQASFTARLRQLPRRLLRPRSLLLPGVLIAVSGWLTFWPCDLRIEASGILVPVRRLHVFAPESGVVRAVHVEDGSIVSDQDLLLELTNEDLQLQTEELHGELGALRARLTAIESVRGDRVGSQTVSLSAEQAELNERIASCERQLQILNVRVEGLAVRTPVSGRIYADRLKEQLAGRPLQRGQYLFQIADPEGDWELELRIPETDVRYVIDRIGEAQTPPLVTFTLETTPDLKMQTQLGRLEQSTELDDRGQLSTRATAPFQNNHRKTADEINNDGGNSAHGIDQDLRTRQRRPGAGVMAQIHCGRRSVGFVLFRKVIDSVRRWVWI